MRLAFPFPGYVARVMIPIPEAIRVGADRTWITSVSSSDHDLQNGTASKHTPMSAGLPLSPLQ